MRLTLTRRAPSHTSGVRRVACRDGGPSYTTLGPEGSRSVGRGTPVTLLNADPHATQVGNVSLYAPSINLETNSLSIQHTTITKLFNELVHSVYTFNRFQISSTSVSLLTFTMKKKKKKEKKNITNKIFPLTLIYDWFFSYKQTDS